MFSRLPCCWANVPLCQRFANTNARYGRTKCRKITSHRTAPHERHQSESIKSSSSMLQSNAKFGFHSCVDFLQRRLGIFTRWCARSERDQSLDSHCCQTFRSKWTRSKQGANRFVTRLNRKWLGAILSNGRHSVDRRRWFDHRQTRLRSMGNNQKHVWQIEIQFSWIVLRLLVQHKWSHCKEKNSRLFENWRKYQTTTAGKQQMAFEMEFLWPEMLTFFIFFCTEYAQR